MLLDRLNITPSSVFIKSTQLEITVSAVFSWTTLISYTIFIITWFSSIKKFSNSLLTDHINLVLCIPGRQCKRLNCWWLQKCSNRNYYDVWNCGLLPSLCLHPRKWFTAWVSVYIGTENSAPVLILGNVEKIKPA